MGLSGLTTSAIKARPSPSRWPCSTASSADQSCGVVGRSVVDANDPVGSDFPPTRRLIESRRMARRLEQGHANSGGRRLQRSIQAGDGQVEADGQLQISGIIGGELVTPGQCEGLTPGPRIGLVIHVDREPSQDADPVRGVGFAGSTSSLPHKEVIGDLQSLERRDGRPGDEEMVEDGIGVMARFISETPGHDDRIIEYEPASGPDFRSGHQKRRPSSMRSRIVRSGPRVRLLPKLAVKPLHLGVGIGGVRFPLVPPDVLRYNDRCWRGPSQHPRSTPRSS